jgi:hypothetical protein
VASRTTLAARAAPGPVRQQGLAAVRGTRGAALPRAAWAEAGGVCGGGSHSHRRAALAGVDLLSAGPRGTVAHIPVWDTGALLFQLLGSSELSGDR